MGMTRKRVYVVYNPSKYNKHMIMQDMEAEGYPFEFVFREDGGRMMGCNEVWYFGVCDAEPDYVIAVRSGLDVWRMA